MNNDDLERDLRRVLSDPGHRLPDRLVPLERVHSGAARRRRRHQAVTASLAVLAVVGIGLGVARPWSTGDSYGTGVAAATSSANPTSPSSLSSAPSVTDSPSTDTSSASATSPSASLDPARIIREFDETQPTSVTAISDQKWWVSNPSTLLATSDDGRSFTVASHEFDPGFDDGYFVAVRFVDPTHGTALLQSRSLTSTVDGGKTWKPVGNGASSFFALEAGGTKTTYALQQGADSGIHLWSQVGTGPWKDVATLDETSTPGGQNVQLAVQGDRAVVVWRTSKAVVSASFDSAGTSSGPTNVSGCAFVLGLTVLSSGRGAVWLSCPTGNSDAVVTSTDLGATWHGVNVPGDAGHHILGAIDATHAVITTSTGLGVLGTDGTLKKATIPEGSAAAMSTYIGFTNPTHGFALADRQLLRSTDGGLTWKAVFYG